MRRLARPAALAALLAVTGGVLAVAPVAQAIPGAALDSTYGDGGVATLWHLDGEPPEPEGVLTWNLEVDPAGRAVVPGLDSGIHRLDISGQPDAEFGIEGLADVGSFDPFSADATVEGIAVAGDSDGVPAVLRLLEDGTPDLRLGGGGLAVLAPPAEGVGGWAPRAVIGPDGALTVLAQWHSVEEALALHRFREDGSVDEGFGERGVVELDVSGDDATASWWLAATEAGIVVVVNHDFDTAEFWSEVQRVRLDGTLDPTFGGDGTVRLDGFGAQSLAIDERDGSLLLGGADAGQAAADVRKLRPDGSPDRRFAGGGPAAVPGSLGLVWGITALPDGRVAVQADGGREVTAILRPDGSPETAFGDGGAIRSAARPLTAGGIGVDPSGDVLVGNVEDREDGMQVTTVRRYDLSGLPSLAPEVTGVEVLDGALSVSWAPAEVELGAPVRAYHVVAFDGQGQVASQQFVASDVRQTSLSGVATASSLLSEVGIGLSAGYSVVVQPHDELGPVIASPPAHVAAVFDPPADATPAEAVTGLAATAGKGHVTVGWVPPADDGGSPVAGYSVIVTEAEGGDLAAWRNVRADLRSASIAGLTAGVAYDVHVLVVTAEGFGSAAPAVAVTPTADGTAPGAPDVSWLSAVPISATHAVVTWGPPVEHGSALIRFHVVVRDAEGNFVAWKAPSPFQRQLVVPAPAGADVYVLAESTAGFGPWKTTTLPG